MNEIAQQHDLADRRWFVVSDEAFEAFAALVDAPARDLPRLRALMATDQET